MSAITLAACGAISPSATPHPAFYSLDRLPATRATSAASSASAAPTAQTGQPTTLTVIVNPPHAVAGLDSARIIYTRLPHKLDYFSHSEWVDPPARMLAPLLVNALENTSAFRAVVLTPAAAVGELRLDTEIVRLQHDFQTRPSHVRFTLRATLVDDKTRRVLAWREFDATAPAGSEDTYGGVVAANQVVQSVLASLAAFCAEAARKIPIGK